MKTLLVIFLVALASMVNCQEYWQVYCPQVEISQTDYLNTITYNTYQYIYPISENTVYSVSYTDLIDYCDPHWTKTYVSESFIQTWPLYMGTNEIQIYQTGYYNVSNLDIKGDFNKMVIYQSSNYPTLKSR